MCADSRINEIKQAIAARNNNRAGIHNHLTEVMFVIDVVDIVVSYCFGDRAIVPLEIAEVLMDQSKKIEIVYAHGLTALIHLSYSDNMGVHMYTIQSTEKWPRYIQWKSLYDLIFTGHSNDMYHEIDRVLPALFTEEKSELAIRIISAGIYDGIYARVE